MFCIKACKDVLETQIIQNAYCSSVLCRARFGCPSAMKCAMFTVAKFMEEKVCTRFVPNDLMVHLKGLKHVENTL
jgi:hypothetical protein